MDCQHKNMKFITEPDAIGRSNVTICTDCDDILAAVDITNGS